MTLKTLIRRLRRAGAIYMFTATFTKPATLHVECPKCGFTNGTPHVGMVVYLAGKFRCFSCGFRGTQLTPLLRMFRVRCQRQHVGLHVG